jgi:2-C-methyl-D-erythritol 4-phosphate cytidylyltransferase
MSDVVALLPVAGLSGRHAPTGVSALSLLDGRSLVERAVTRLLTADSVDEIVVIADPDVEIRGLDIRVVSGTTADIATVLARDFGVVLVHDPLRPLIPANVVDRVVAAVLKHRLPAVPVLPCSDTVKLLDASGVVIDTLDRTALRVTQTPIGYPAELIVDGVVVAGEVPVTALTVTGDPAGRRLATAVDRAMIRP